MAKIVSASSTIELLPIRWETPGRGWMEVEIALEFHVQGQNFHLRIPPDLVSLTQEEVATFIQRSTQYVDQLSESQKILKDGLKRYTFIPMEPNFTIELSSGYYTNKEILEGIMYFSFELELKNLKVKTLRGDSIGCTVEIDVLSFLKFLQDLKDEVDNLG